MNIGELFAENAGVFLWLGVAIAAAIVESMTCDLVAIWFVPGALAAMVFSIFVDSFLWQTVLFLGLSVVVLVLMKTVFKKYLPQNRSTKMNADAIIGTHGIVEEEIDNLLGTGSVKIGALVWTARSTDDNVKIPSGSLITVCEIRGVKAICEPRTENK